MNSINLEEKKFTFQSNKIIEIENFLNNDYAEKIHNFLSKQIPEDWWVRSINIQSLEYPKFVDIVQNNDNQIKIKYLTELANRSFSNHIFSYSFDKSWNHYSTCSCDFCFFMKYLNSDEFINTISHIVDVKLTKTTEVFASRYTEGCFLSPHHDKTKGKIGFVMNFTKEWRPEYGGILHIMDKDEINIIKSFTPKFNHLILFHIPNPEGIPHFVSHIAHSVNNKRLAITGWFN